MCRIGLLVRFNDFRAADDIRKSTSVTRIIKSDKYVDGFDEEIWNSIYRNVIKDGYYHKVLKMLNSFILNIFYDNN